MRCWARGAACLQGSVRVCPRARVRAQSRLTWPAAAQVEGQDEEQLRFLLAHDRDPFCRWEAGQRLLRALLTALYAAAADESKARAPSSPKQSRTDESWHPSQADLDHLATVPCLAML